MGDWFYFVVAAIWGFSGVMWIRTGRAATRTLILVEQIIEHGGRGNEGLMRERRHARRMIVLSTTLALVGMVAFGLYLRRAIGV